MNSNTWHLLSNEETLNLLETDMYRGLSPDEAKRRKRKYGPNSVWHVRRTPAGEVAAAALFDLPTLLLVISAAAAALFSKQIEAGAIVAVLILGAILRTVIYVRANRILEDMAKTRIPVASVIRGARIHLLPAGEIVPGDIIFLETGDTVPCDGRVLSGEDSIVSERGITENTLPVHKFNTVISSEAESGEIPCEFRSNMLFAGSLVLSGSLRIAATACGDDTLISMKQGGITLEAETDFPLVEKLRRQSRNTSLFLLAAVLILTVLSLFVDGGFTLPDVFLGTMAMAVAAMSEFLSTVACIVIAVTVRDEADGKTGTGQTSSLSDLFRKKPEDSDKKSLSDGGLRVVFREPSKLEEVAEPDALVFCGSTFFKSGRAELLAYRAKGVYTGIDEEGGDPGELLAYAICATEAGDRRTGVSRRGQKGAKHLPHRASQRAIITALAADVYVKKTGESLDYGLASGDHRDSSARGSMGMEVSLCAYQGDVLAVGCGGIGEVLNCCNAVETEDGVIPLTPELKKTYITEAATLEFGGARVLAVAKRSSPYPHLNRLPVLTQMMTFVGFFAVSLEPEAEARENIEYLKACGIRPILFTESPDEDLYYCHRLGLFNKNTPIVPYAEWNVGKARAILADREHASDGMILSFADIGDAYLGGAYAAAMVTLCGAKPDGDETVVTAIGMEAWDAGALGRADLGFAAARSKWRAVPESLARSSSVVIHPDPNATEAGYGGLAGAVSAIRASLRALHNVAAAKFYMMAAQSARLTLVLAAILATLPGWIDTPLISAVFILIWGLLFDFSAVLVTAFEKESPLPEKKRHSDPDESDEEARARAERKRDRLFNLGAGGAGILWGVLLVLLSAGIGVLSAKLLPVGWSADAQRTFLSASAILTGLVFSAECASRSSLFRRRTINAAQLVFVLVSLLFSAWILFTSTGASVIGGSPCGVFGLTALVPALVLLGIAEVSKLILRHRKAAKTA